MLADLSVERAALRERFRLAQLTHMEVIASRARLIENIAQSRELIAHADFLLTLPYLIRPTDE
jgi:hypothetical protein